MAGTPHRDKNFEKALRFVEEQGWRIVRSGSHAWGKIYCPYNDAECRCVELCITSIWSTPRNPGNHARALLRVVANCQRRASESTSNAKAET